MAKKNYYLIFLMLSLFITNVSAGNIAPVEQLKAKLTQHQGKVIYVDFWASWCGPCRESFPWLNNIQADIKMKGF